MVSDSANISGSKLDISSVITQINNNETTINSSHIKFDDTGQSLLVAFNTLKNKVDTIEEATVSGDLSSVIEKVNTHTTQIEVMQGQISSLIDNTTITKQDGTVVQLKDEYNTTKSTVNSNTTKIGSLETNYNKVSGDLESVTSKQSAMEQNLEGFKTTVSETYVSNTNFSRAEEGINNNITSSVEDAKGEILNNITNNYVDKDTYAQFTSSVSSSFEQTTSDMEMKFTTVSEGFAQVNDKDTVSTNIRFSEDGVEIGKTNSPFGVSISNKKMSFTENNTEIAYISNQEMLITDANVTNSLKIGHYKFIPRNNGNLSLIWVNE